jgi:hypothetical protein
MTRINVAALCERVTRGKILSDIEGKFEKTACYPGVDRMRLVSKQWRIFYACLPVRWTRAYVSNDQINARCPRIVAVRIQVTKRLVSDDWTYSCTGEYNDLRQSLA